MRRFGRPTHRSSLSLALGCCLASAGPTAYPAPVWAASSASPEAQSAEQLYDEGRKAYRIGDFKTAVEKWQLAYEVSDNGLLLYNISLAFKGLYTISNDLGDLRRSRAVLDNFIKVASADPNIDPDDAPARLAELDEMIAEASKAQAQAEPAVPPPDPAPSSSKPEPDSDTDPGRKLRMAGAGVMISGGAVALAGAGLAAFYAIKGQEFSSNLRRDNDEFTESGCESRPDDLECQQLSLDIETWRDNGQQANVLAVVMGAGLGGLGAVALVAGGLVFNEGNKRTRQWEKGIARIQVSPRWGGISVSGRF